MHAQQQLRAVGDGTLVIADTGAIGGSDLAQHRARFRHHVGNAERAADLDQLAARNQNFAAFGQRVERQQHGSGVVVDHDGRDFALGSVEQLRKQPIDVDVALAALAGIEIELEIRVSLRNFDRTFQSSVA